MTEMDLADLLGVKRRAPLYQQIYQSIREAVVSGNIAPGTLLTEVGVAELLRVSRTPVREALKQLVREGLLEVRPDGVACVPDVTVAQVAEVYAARGVLEGLAAAMACTGGSAEHVSRMREIVVQSQEALQHGQLARLPGLNTQFHETLIQASKSEAVRSLVERLRDRVMRYREWSLRDPESARLSVAEHEQIVTLLERGESSASQAFVSAHVHRAGWRVVLRIAGGSLPAGAPAIEFLRQVSRQHVGLSGPGDRWEYGERRQ